MTDKKYTVGVDFGTLSGRAVLVDVANGEELASSTLNYPHAVMDAFMPDGVTPLPPDWALQHPQDYLDVLSTTIPAVLAETGVSPDDVIGVGIDFTASTLMPVYRHGTPLCLTERYKNEPHAYVKLWKHHAAQSYANRMTDIAKERGEMWLNRYGGKISSEWTFPKIWQTLDEAPEVYREADAFVEAADWIVWQLCGESTRNSCSAGYKAFYCKGEGYPSKDFFRALDPRLGGVIEDKMNAPVRSIGGCAGYVTEAASALTGLKVGTAVAVANVDAHVTVPALGIDGPGKMLAIMGTSTCHMLMDRTAHTVPGMCGMVEGGILPGFFGYEAGQSCVGDHFAWFVDRFTPATYVSEAEARGIFPMQLMVEKAAALKPGESGILALDWWNGNRSVLVDAALSGLFLGMSLQTRPEEMFRALVEATAFGTRKIIETFRSNGVPVNELYAAGGISQKDPFTMQIYADVTGMEIRISGSKQAPALGSAIFAAAAAGEEAGGYADVFDAAKRMGKLSERIYRPCPENQTIYDRLYVEYDLLHEYFGRGENNVMKRLRALRAEAKMQ
ncbi:MAG: ribulokinase [Clostridia bacterium]|nr:ribulokinase [Clostridia bacterium]